MSLSTGPKAPTFEGEKSDPASMQPRITEAMLILQVVEMVQQVTSLGSFLTKASSVATKIIHLIDLTDLCVSGRLRLVRTPGSETCSKCRYPGGLRSRPCHPAQSYAGLAELLEVCGLQFRLPPQLPALVSREASD